ncbi:tetratricopeptide repeat protein [Occallatibacter savannae]|uniref:tetratricopeptide repeat protein n=1 Tax=Occallatibacter savannae TaxID=1002691 RepID=UPI000D69100E|nr:tetratricopeptide repeat protein [Occallatibacter savannae]
MTSFSRQDVQRILQISSRQLQGWEKAGLISPRETYTFQDLGQLRTLRSLREEDVSAASIRHSITAMQAVAGLSNPLQQASLVRSGSRLAFRVDGAMMDPIRRQLMFDFERIENDATVRTSVRPLRRVDQASRGIQELFVTAVQAEESGDKHRAISIYEEMLRLDPDYAPGYINLGTIHFHLKQYTRAEELYRTATRKDPGYVLAFFDLGNVLDELDRPDESIAAYQRAVELAPRYADAHYNLALAFERKGEKRAALRHWQAYARLDKRGPWAEHARGQIRKLLESEKLTIAARAEKYIAPKGGGVALQLVPFIG